MKIYAAVNSIPVHQKISFSSNIEEITPDNIDEFLRQNQVDLLKSYEDSLIIKASAAQERAKLLHIKRTLNEKKIIGNNRETSYDSFDIVNRFRETKGLIARILGAQSIQATGLTGQILPEENYFKGIYRHSMDSFSKGVSNSGFINTINVPGLDFNEIGSFGGDNATKTFAEIFSSFKKSDSPLVEKSILAFSKISTNFFEHTNSHVKEILEMKSKKGTKWLERIPGVGVGLRLGRVSEQQQCIKYVYEDFNDYCSTFIHKGIHPITGAYVQKISQTEKNLEMLSTYLTNRDRVFVDKVISEMKKIATPLIDSYIKILSSVTSNGENIAQCYRGINNNGNISALMKLVRTFAAMS